jgi:hypothetical protein
MTSADKLKAIIKEEVRKAVRQELKQIIKESYEPTSNYASSIEKQVKNNVSSTNKPKKSVNPSNFGNNPFASMLQETAMSFSTEDVHSFGGGKSRVSLSEPLASNAKVGSVNDMLSTAKPSSNLDMVNIDTVPDFSALMSKMKQNGQI